ncbi:MarR family transcriptional regulator [Aureimonas ureilytica]|uniref:MarR family transcriptional regulator n=1 Tax=Aureimonas ureilytica TaxID=401562 RepID=UPI000370F383|nr:MarR family transcriptional regulator [Aureimonas ureilytica]
MGIDIKPAQALRLLYRNAILQAQHPGLDLTARQTAILLSIYLDPPPHTVRGLAEKLQVAKPVVTRALDSMGRMNLLERQRDPSDLRNVLVRRTVEGSQFVSEMADRLVSEAGALAR